MSAAAVVPTVDLDAVSAEQFVDHLREFACVVVTAGHGIPDELWRATIATSRAFFARDEAAKRTARWNGQQPWLGWLPVGATDPPGVAPKLLEKYELQLPIPWTGDPGDLVGRGASFPYWPDGPGDFRELWTRMYDALGALAVRVMDLLIDGLGLPDSDRAPWTTHHFANLVANNYLPQTEAPSAQQTRLPGHVDIGGVTLLSADEAPGGLEVRVDGGWVPVVLPPNAYLIQVGDLLRRWTDNVIPGNVHRVVNPPPEVAAESQRISLVYFHYPAPDHEVVPAATRVKADVAARPPLSTHEHMLERQRREQYDGVYADEFA